MPERGANSVTNAGPGWRGWWLAAAVAGAIAQPLVAWWWIASRGTPAGSLGELASWWLGLAGFLFFAVASVVLATVDVVTLRLPNVIVLPSLGVLVLLLGASALAALDWPRLALSLGVGAAGFAVYLALALIAPGGLGGGDVKLAGLVGVVLGYLGVEAVLWGFVGGFVCAGLASGLALIARGRARANRIAFAPWMLLGAWVGAVFVGGA